MSTVIVDIDDQEEDSLTYGYQLIREDDYTYGIWMSTGPVRGKWLFRNIDTFEEAFDKLHAAVWATEGMGLD